MISGSSYRLGDRDDEEATDIERRRREGGQEHPPQDERSLYDITKHYQVWFLNGNTPPYPQKHLRNCEA